LQLADRHHTDPDEIQFGKEPGEAWSERSMNWMAAYLEALHLAQTDKTI
jgi:hypothetical protein